MAFNNRGLAKRVAKQPCTWCGWIAGRRHAAHIIDEGPEAEWNAISLCPNCSTVFDEVVRPMFYKALQEFGCVQLPQSWSKDNKISEIANRLSEEEYRRLNSKLNATTRNLKTISNNRSKSEKQTEAIDERAAKLLARVKKRIEGKQQAGEQQPASKQLHM